jgi:hypothetical protein
MGGSIPEGKNKNVHIKEYQGAWSGAGLSPWTPQKIYNQLPTRQPQALTTPIRQGQFDSSLLDSSPPDGTELRNSNAALNLLLAAQNGVDTPTRKYVARLTQTSERLSTQVIMLQKELEEKEKVLNQRSTRQKGKRIVLRDVVVLSTEAIRSAIVEAEERYVRRGNLNDHVKGSMLRCF